jgi:hypothetical protein
VLKCAKGDSADRSAHVAFGAVNGVRTGKSLTWPGCKVHTKLSQNPEVDLAPASCINGEPQIALQKHLTVSNKNKPMMDFLALQVELET